MTLSPEADLKNHIRFIAEYDDGSVALPLSFVRRSSDCEGRWLRLDLCSLCPASRVPVGHAIR